MLKDVVLPLVATVLTAVLGAAGVLLQEWRQKRDDHHRRRQERVEASEMIEFVQKWIQTQQLACSPEELVQVKQTARQQLEGIYNSLVKVQEAKRPDEHHSFFSRALLLYKPPGFGALLLHVIFYTLMIVLMLSVLFTVTLSFDPLNKPGDLPRAELIGGMTIVYVILLIPALSVRAWAISIDRRHRKMQTS